MATFEGAILEISWISQNVPEGKTDPNSTVFEISSKVDKRHGFKAIFGFWGSEPALDSVGIKVISRPLCEA